MSNPVKVKVKIFGAPSLALESREVTLELKENATTDDLLKSISVEDKDYLYVVRGGIRLNRSTKLNDGDEVLVVPPIAGG
ncbi:MAG: MoaD/ThiS family protein [Candidatus Bathyarchaeia archaeon]|jgi:molybdopterin converting factor small subunit